jgi:phosphoserine phosphatase
VSDIHVFEAVGHPVCINPDSKLRKYAIAKNWSLPEWN